MVEGALQVKGVVAMLALVAMLLGACGSATASFPDEAECPAPAPLPTSSRNPGATSPDAYVRRMQGFARNLEHLRASLKAKYPEDTFYRREQFRPDFAEYASQTVCTAQSMLDLAPPDARYKDYDSALDVLLAELIDHTRAGREAVRTRNVSDYRDWYEEAEWKISRVRLAADSLPR